MADRLAQIAAALVKRFGRQRPVRAGSLIITLFGDAIVPRGGAVTLGSLIALCATFGLKERLVRTSVARLAHKDWLVARRSGRRSEYALSANGRRRFEEATRRIYGESFASLPGRWTLVLLPEGMGAGREAMRRKLRWLGFGQPCAGVFAHPTLAGAEARRQLEQLGGADGAVFLEAASSDRAHDRRLAQAGWQLGELAGRYRSFVKTFEPARRALRAGVAPAPKSAFFIRTLLIHEYRKIHLWDPQLPPALLPTGWIGAAAYDLCREVYGQVFALAEPHIDIVAERFAGPLPPASATAARRFGGLILP